MKKTGVLALVAAGALACPAVAQAHVSLHPNTVPTGSFATLDIRVPNEETRANTAKLVVQMPPGFTDASIGDVPGWTAKVATHKLAKPVKTDDGLQTEGVSKITWIGTGSLGKIPPRDFQSFPISVEIPGKPGSVLTFKTLQYYDSGKIVRWIGPPDSETPAPTVDVTAPGGVLEDVAGGEAGPAGVGPTASTTDSSDGGSSDTLAIIALIVGALGLVAGGAALIRGRAAG
jgi:periplasmic copper chaperone A